MKIGKRFFLSIIKFIKLDLLLKFFLQRIKVTILLLHDPTPESLDQLLNQLRTKYNFISFIDFLQCRVNNKLFTLPKYSAVLTFDDGHKGNYKLLPVFVKHNIPATIFCV